MAKRARLILATLLVLCGIALADAAVDQETPKEHAPLELFGIGPEMFQNRMVIWIKGLGEISRTLISELGLVALAGIGLWKTLKQATSDAHREAKDAEMKERLDRQGERLDKVALSVPVPPGGLDEPITVENANVQIQPEAGK